jgi:hypothetical protein
MLGRTGQKISVRPNPSSPRHPFTVGWVVSGPTGRAVLVGRLLLDSLGRFRVDNPGPAETESDRHMLLILLLFIIITYINNQNPKYKSKNLIVVRWKPKSYSRSSFLLFVSLHLQSLFFFHLLFWTNKRIFNSCLSNSNRSLLFLSSLSVLKVSFILLLYWFFTRSCKFIFSLFPFLL